MRRIHQAFLNWRQIFRGPAITPATADIIALLDASAGQKLGSSTLADVLALKSSYPVARYYTEYATYSDITAAIPIDDTVPGSAEGTEIFSRAHAAAVATNRVRITVQMAGTGNGANGSWAMSLLKDGTCIHAATLQSPNTGVRPDPKLMVYEFVPGDTSSHTYSVRVGIDSGSLTHLYLNGNASSRLLGGAMCCKFLLEEFEALA